MASISAIKAQAAKVARDTDDPNMELLAKMVVELAKQCEDAQDEAKKAKREAASALSEARRR